MQHDLALADMRPLEMIEAAERETQRVRDAGAAIVAALDDGDGPSLPALDAAVRRFGLEVHDNSDGNGDWCEYTLNSGPVRLFMDYSRHADADGNHHVISLRLRDGEERTRRDWRFDADWHPVPGHCAVDVAAWDARPIGAFVPRIV